MRPTQETTGGGPGGRRGSSENKEKLTEVDSGCWVGRLIGEPCHWESVTGMVVNHRPGGRLCSR